MSWLEFMLITLFNATVCLLLPPVVALNWGKLTSACLKSEKIVSPQSSQLSPGTGE